MYPGADAEIGTVLHHRFQPGQLLQIDGEDDFVDDVVLQNTANRSERENVVAAELVSRCVADIGINEALQPQAHTTALFNQRRHLARPWPATDNQQVVIAAQAFTH